MDYRGCSALHCIQSDLAICRLKVGILGTQSPKYVQVKGLQTSPFKSSWLPNVNINLNAGLYCIQFSDPALEIRQLNTRPLTRIHMYYYAPYELV